MLETSEKTPSASGERYYPQLDGIRALAVGTVFIGHLIPSPLLVKIVSWGDTGVVLFFCLSGFLITGILLKIRQPETSGKFTAVRAFYFRRALRIFPIYYLTIAVAVIVGYGPAREHFFRLVTYTLNVPGLPPTDKIGAVSHFWSLSVEEQFYLFWPLLVLFFPRRYLQHLVVSLISLSLLYKLSLVALDASYKLVFASLWGCLDSLGLGALLAIAWNRSDRPVEATRHFVQIGKISGGIWVCMTVVRIVSNIDPYYEGYRWFGVLYFAVAALAFTGLIAFAASGTTSWFGNFLGNGLMVRTGRISYGLYVYHFFFPYILPWMVGRGYIHLTSPWHYAGLSILGSVILATLSWRFIERPILGLKKYFDYAATTERSQAH